MPSLPLIPPPRAALVASGVILGWTAVDFTALATSGNAYLIQQVLPGYAVAVGVAVIVGTLLALHSRLCALCLVAVGILGIAPKLAGLNLPWHLVCLPRVIFLLVAAFSIASVVARRRPSAFAPAVALGTIAATLFSAISSGSVPPSGALVLVSGSAVLLVLPRTMAYRRAVALLVALLVVAVLAVISERSNRLTRPDQVSPTSAVAAASAPNLILVVLDTVSVRRLALYGHERVTTPGLDEFVRRHAVRYTQARSTSSWTLPAHASIFTGLFPAQHGADHPRESDDPGTEADNAATSLGLYPADGLRADVPTLAETLAARGYQTAGIVANNGYLSHVFGLDRGFAHYDDRGGTALRSLLLVQVAGYQQHLRKGPRRADRITDLGLEWLGAPERRQPFFLFLNYMDAHGPYVPPEPYAGEFESVRPADPIKYDRSLYPLQYDRELRYLDAQLTRFLNSLEQRGLLDNTVLVITSDHGEGFGEHGFWRHDLALYDELIAVPLYVKAAGRPAPGVSQQPITSAGLHQLILDQLGIANAATDTEQVTAEWYRSPALNQAPELHPDGNQSIDRDLVAWLDKGQKWIVASDGTVTVYDLESDPGEQHPLPISPDQAEQARARARNWWQAHPPIPRTERNAKDLDPAVIDRLRNLGYVH